MATKYENHTFAWAGTIANAYSNIWYAQTFTLSTTHLIEHVILGIGRAGSPGTVTVSIRATAGGVPTGGDLCSGTTDGDTLPALGWPTPAPESRQIDFSTNPELTNGTTYAIIVRATSGNSSNKVMWSRDGNNYAGGQQCFSNNSGSSWSAGSSGIYDQWFEEWGYVSNPPSKPTTPSPADSATSVDFSNLTLGWADGGGADTFDVYIGPVGNLSLISSAQAGTTKVVDMGDIPWGETIYWRIDASNGDGTTTGDTWSFDTVIIRNVKLGGNGAYIVITAKDGVYLSTDSGANWSRKTPDAVEDTDWVKGICSSTGTYIITVSSADAIYRSANSGTSWAAITPAGGDTFAVSDMATSDDGQFMVIAGTNSTDGTESCYVSINYGVAWTAYKPVAASIAWTECDISNDGVVIAVSKTDYFYVSFDSGATWMEQGMASTDTTWIGLGISGDGTTGLIANSSVNNECFIGTKTELYSEATWAESDLTSAGRAILDDATAADQAVTLGLEIGVDTQAWDAQLDDIAALAVTDSNFLVGNGSNWIAESGNTARTSLGLGTGDSPEFAGQTITGNSVFGLNSSVFQPTTDSTTFFQILDADSGTPVLSVDTTNERVGIGVNKPEGYIHIVGASYPLSRFTRTPTGNDFWSTIDFQAVNTGASITDDFGVNFGLTIGDSAGRSLVARFGAKRDGADNSGRFLIETYNAGTPATHFVIDKTGKVGIGELAPETKFEITSTTPYLTLHNSTHEDLDGGRESRLNFKGEQSGGEETTLARIEVGHDGVADDEKGKLVISVNDGNDGDTPTEVMRLSSGGGMYLKEVATADFDIAGKGQLWVKTVTPNELWFTDDAGTDVQLGKRFVDRGNYILMDFASLTSDGAWHTLDLTSIMPVGAKLVMLRTMLIGLASTPILKVKTNGNANDSNVAISMMETNGFPKYDTLWVAPDADGKIEYWLTNVNYVSKNISIGGWVL